MRLLALVFLFEPFKLLCLLFQILTKKIIVMRLVAVTTTSTAVRTCTLFARPVLIELGTLVSPLNILWAWVPLPTEVALLNTYLHINIT